MITDWIGVAFRLWPLVQSIAKDPQVQAVGRKHAPTVAAIFAELKPIFAQTFQQPAQGQTPPDPQWSGPLPGALTPPQMPRWTPPSPGETGNIPFDREGQVF